MRWGVLLVCMLCMVGIRSEDPLPIILWHGMGDTCCFPFSMGYIASLLSQHMPNVSIQSIEIGSNMVEDEFHGFIGDVNLQIEQVYQNISAQPKYEGGFNVIGFSQGGQFLRGLLQRYDLPIHHYVSIGGQHQGVYGIPQCIGANYTLCDMMRRLLDYGAYIPYVQAISVQAQYWHDPYCPECYLKHCAFLPSINQYNETQRNRVLRLKSMTLVKFEGDTIVQPRESQWFGFFKNGSGSEVYTLFESELYQKDYIGLKALNESNRLHLLSTPGNHMKFTASWFINTIIPILNT